MTSSISSSSASNDAEEALGEVARLGSSEYDGGQVVQAGVAREVQPDLVHDRRAPAVAGQPEAHVAVAPGGRAERAVEGAAGTA